jgi:hypothetical protein
MKVLFGVLGVGGLCLVFGIYNLLVAASVLLTFTIIGGIGYGLGYEHGKTAGEIEGERTEGERMLGDDPRDSPEEDDAVKPLQTCRWCGHIMSEQD